MARAGDGEMKHSEPVFKSLTNLVEETDKYVNQSLRMTQKWRSALGIMRARGGAPEPGRGIQEGFL